jgi:hypothetical protein
MDLLFLLKRNQQDRKKMEQLVSALVALNQSFRKEEPYVPEPEGFKRFDVGALKRVYQAPHDSSNLPERRESYVPQVAS